MPEASMLDCIRYRDRGVETAAATSAGTSDLKLPVDEYAVLVALSISPSSLVVADSGNLPRSGSLPREVFPCVDLLSREEPIRATTEELMRAGLDEVFPSNPSTYVKAIPLYLGSTAAASLLLKIPSIQLASDIANVVRDQDDALRSVIEAAAGLAITYEWEMMKHIFRCQSPCVVVDGDKRIVCVNSILSDMVGRSSRDLIGRQVEDLMYFEREPATEVPCHPECVEVTTSVFVKPLYLFFTSNVGFTRFRTACGDRTVYLIQDIFTDRRAANSNALLVQKLSAALAVKTHPQTTMLRLINVTTLTLGCDLVCVLKRRSDDKMIVTPYSNRRSESLHANVIEAASEPVLAPFVRDGSPVFCENVAKACPDGSFFKRLMPLSKFALLPIGDGQTSDHVLMLAWSRPDSNVGAEAVPLLRTVANLMGMVLVCLELSAEMEHERETLRRYSRLTAGREARMAELKRQNAGLRERLMKLGFDGKE